MATILLSAAGAAIGGGFGGSILGLSGAVIGRAIGATLGRVLDQRLMGSGSSAVETGHVDRFRLTGASEGAPVGQVWGRMRVAGQVIWASRFLEKTTTTTVGGGKGAPPKPKTTTTEFSYSVSLALALCQGEITRVGRIWADGVEISRDEVTMRVYSGAESQLPDPKIEAVEGAGLVPVFSGLNRWRLAHRQPHGPAHAAEHLDQRVDRELRGLLVHDIGHTRARHHQNRSRRPAPVSI